MRLCAAGVPASTLDVDDIVNALRTSGDDPSVCMAVTHVLSCVEREALVVHVPQLVRLLERDEQAVSASAVELLRLLVDGVMLSNSVKILGAEYNVRDTGTKPSHYNGQRGRVVRVTPGVDR